MKQSCKEKKKGEIPILALLCRGDLGLGGHPRPTYPGHAAQTEQFWTLSDLPCGGAGVGKIDGGTSASLLCRAMLCTARLALVALHRPWWLCIALYSASWDGLSQPR